MTKEALILLIKSRGKTITGAADALGYSRQNLYKRMDAGTLNEAELARLAAYLGGVYVSQFVFADSGTDPQP